MGLFRQVEVAAGGGNADPFKGNPVFRLLAKNNDGVNAASLYIDGIEVGIPAGETLDYWGSDSNRMTITDVSAAAGDTLILTGFG